MRPSSVNFKHIVRLTDDTGILEHALGCIPRRKEGYSTDDQARALWVCLEWIDYVAGDEAQVLSKLIDTYLSFLLWAQRENGHFHNNFAFDRTKENESPSDDCLGRCLWACAFAMTKLKDNGRVIAATEIFKKAMGQVAYMQYPRGWAYALSAFSLLVRHEYPLQLASEIKMLSARLIDSYRQHSKPDWHWYETSLTYGNGIIPWGLLCAYEILKQEEILAVARDSLDFLIRFSSNEKGQIRPVGNRGWCTSKHRALWDQQPVDVMKLALAASKAYEITGLSKYSNIVARCRSWFHGDNDAGIAMIHEQEGGCYDGLGENGPNLNQGAEAVISYLLTEAICLNLTDRNRVGEYETCIRS